MTQAEADAALARIGEIVREGAVGVAEDDLDRARAALEAELWEAAEALRAVVRCEDGAVGVVVTDGTGDVYCVWADGAGPAERARHLERFQGEVMGRIRVGYLLAAAGRAALALTRLAAARELVAEVRLLRAAMG